MVRTDLPGSLRKEARTLLNLEVSGMTCGHCVSAVSRAVKAVPGAVEVAVDLRGGAVQVGGNPDPAAMRDAISAEGYEVQAA